MALNVNKPIEIRDFRNGSWFWIQTHVWRDTRLKGADRNCYGTIASYANQDQETFPSIIRIATDSGLSERQVYTSIKNLEKYGYLIIKRNRGGHNVYTLAKTYPAPESELREHTPAKIAPLTGVQVTPAKSTVGTPAKNGVRTIKDITRTNNKSNPILSDEDFEKWNAGNYTALDRLNDRYPNWKYSAEWQEAREYKQSLHDN